MRITACWALGNFSTLPEVKSFLHKLTKNKKELGLAQVAQEALEFSDENC